jgi:hypothetical protein
VTYEDQDVRFMDGDSRQRMARGGRCFRQRLRKGIVVALGFLGPQLLALGSSPAPPSPVGPESPVAQYEAEVPKTIVGLQQFRQTETATIEGPDGKRGTATLVNLNPLINVWYLLLLSWEDGSPGLFYHLQNSHPHEQRLSLGQGGLHGVAAVETGSRSTCDLWSSNAKPSLAEARASHSPYAPLCDGRLYLRNLTEGRSTAREAVADFLRKHVWGGEKIVVFVRDTFFKDRWREEAKVVAGSEGVPAAPENGGPPGPLPAHLDPAFTGRLVATGDLGIDIQTPGHGVVAFGEWYPVRDNAGVFVSVIQPAAVTAEILQSYPRVVHPLDSVERSALVYLVAFDLSQFDLAFVLGTEHPRVGWSARVLPEVRDRRLPGPDGIGTIAPLVATGMISPAYAPRTVATFAGGYKREHGAFRYGKLARINHGSHYGFIEEGVVFSKLQPGLSTIFVLEDGSVRLKTWTDADNRLLGQIRYARQNGVPVIEHDEGANRSFPGPLVGEWGPGNWSGSEAGKLRTLRAGLALQEANGKRFLIYGYFSTATPSSMARVFQAYRCRYAMHLDMNALEHTYLALYTRQSAHLLVQHLIQGMSELDKTVDGGYVPRFIGYPDNRDFFYLTRREERRLTP